MDVEMDITRSQVGNGAEARTIEFVDFSKGVVGGRSDAYKMKCESGDLGGVYEALDYVLECTDGSGDEEVDVYTKGHPRCYSSICDFDENGEDDKMQLFYDFTVKLTEERNPGWKCMGDLHDGDPSIFSACGLETQQLNELTAIFEAAHSIKTPEILEKKYFFFFPMKEKDVTFSTSAAFSTACAAQHGKYEEVAGAKIMCRVDGGVEADGKPFDLTSFPVCLGTSCLDSTNKEDAVAHQFQQKMLNAKEIDYDMVCTITSGGAMIASFGVGGLLSSMLALVGWSVL